MSDDDKSDDPFFAAIRQDLRKLLTMVGPWGLKDRELMGRYLALRKHVNHFHPEPLGVETLALLVAIHPRGMESLRYGWVDEIVCFAARFLEQIEAEGKSDGSR